MAAVRDIETEIEDRIPNSARTRVSYGYGPREQSDEFEQDDPESSSLGDPQSVHLLVQEAGQDASASSGALKNEFEQFLHKNNKCTQSFFNKGVYATLFFFVITVIGIGLVEGLFGGIGVLSQRFSLIEFGAFNNTCFNGVRGVRSGCFASRFVRAFGLFGFVGGLSNWFAAEMLFIKIPFCFGSGVFIRHYKSIRTCLQKLVLKYVFDAGSLQQYVNSEQSEITKVLNLDERMRVLVQPESAKKLVTERLRRWRRSKEAVSLFMMGVDPERLKGFLEPRLLQLAEELSPVLSKSMCRSHDVDAVRIQQEVERLVEKKIPTVSAKMINQILAVMIRKDLSWLVVYGCLAGAAIGFITEFATIAIEESLFVQLRESFA